MRMVKYEMDPDSKETKVTILLHNDSKLSQLQLNQQRAGIAKNSLRTYQSILSALKNLEHVNDGYMEQMKKQREFAE